MHLLKIKILDNCPNREFVKEYYQHKVGKVSHDDDCGIDLIFPDDIKFITHKVTHCDLGIACEMVSMNGKSEPCILVSRSSITKTPLQLANAIGIIDRQYRGAITAALECKLNRDHPSTLDKSEYVAKKGERLVQIIAFDGEPIKVIVVDVLTETKRGSGGFGSTNK